MKLTLLTSVEQDQLSALAFLNINLILIEKLLFACRPDRITSYFWENKTDTKAGIVVLLSLLVRAHPISVEAKCFESKTKGENGISLMLFYSLHISVINASGVPCHLFVVCCRT